MQQQQPSKLAFLVGCIGARLALAYGISIASGNVLKALSVLTGAMALGFFTIWAFGWRKTGPETGGKPIWWNHMRPLHAMAYGIAAALAWTGHGLLAGCVIAADTMIGLMAFLHHHRLSQIAKN